jgi:hypothetical protein
MLSPSDLISDFSCRLVSAYLLRYPESAVVLPHIGLTTNLVPVIVDGCFKAKLHSICILRSILSSQMDYGPNLQWIRPELGPSLVQMMSVSSDPIRQMIWKVLKMLLDLDERIGCVVKSGCSDPLVKSLLEHVYESSEGVMCTEISAFLSVVFPE